VEVILCVTVLYKLARVGKKMGGMILKKERQKWEVYLIRQQREQQADNDGVLMEIMLTLPCCLRLRVGLRAQ
jgi:hypothetical protein